MYAVLKNKFDAGPLSLGFPSTVFGESHAKVELGTAVNENDADITAIFALSSLDTCMHCTSNFRVFHTSPARPHTKTQVLRNLQVSLIFMLSHDKYIAD